MSDWRAPNSRACRAPALWLALRRTSRRRPEVILSRFEPNSSPRTARHAVGLAALALLSLSLPATAADNVAEGPSPVGAGSVPISFTHASAWFAHLADDHRKLVTLLVYFGGSPGWHDRATAFNWTINQSPATIDMTVGTTPIHVRYWRETSVIDILGQQFDLARANVFLVTDVDTAKPGVRDLGTHDLSFSARDNPAVALLARDAAVRTALVADTAVVREERRPKPVGSAAAVAWDEAGLALIRRGDPGDADSLCALFRRAADTGYAPAQYRLGYCYENGIGVARDAAIANAWYLRAARQGNVDAQYKLGYSYRSGRGMTIDLAEALRWYKAAAASGDLDALHAVGYMIAHGEGVAANAGEAYAWFLKAAEEGSTAAQFELAQRLHDGDGVTRDPAGAFAWMLVLRAQSKELTPDSARLLESLGQAMESEVDSAARAAAEPRAQALMRSLAKRYVARLGR